MLLARPDQEHREGGCEVGVCCSHFEDSRVLSWEQLESIQMFQTWDMCVCVRERDRERQTDR